MLKSMLAMLFKCFLCADGALGLGDLDLGFCYKYIRHKKKKWKQLVTLIFADSHKHFKGYPVRSLN